MKSLAVFLVIFGVAYSPYLNAQQKKKPIPENKKSAEPAKKYPSLLWEITGNGMTKPSYLFGTMHVSDKLVFHLGDSFYNAIKSVDVVALETNPETWQDDYSKSAFFKNSGSGRNHYQVVDDIGQDNLSINSFAIESYAEILKAGLAVEPSMINGMLYRTYGTRIDDFEEDTFLDMYLFQVGKKLGKRVTGVENFQESEKLVMEAYRDMIRDKNKKKRSYDFEGMMNNPKKIEDAYRNGDLDVLDSLESLTIYSDAFQEKFLYKRNLIQANSIDSIIRRSPLFVGVGAAHLPGRRGVIEMLRGMGYNLRPIIMDERNSAQKESIEKIHLPYEFKQQTATDGEYKVSIPGEKFYRFTNWSGMDIVQYADMVNGTYYMVNRIKTNGLFFGDNMDKVQKKVDSLLYENIPGKILKKTTITKNGYRGIDIMNRTRRGDYQRYNIFVTPFEVIIFKMSGNGEYVNTADDGQKFFGSIRLQEAPQVNWQNWQPATGGFNVRLPHVPLLYQNKDYGTDRMEYVAADKEKGSNYIIMKASVHNFTFFEHDSFELNLLDESYSYSPFIDKELSRKFLKVSGYPALDCYYRHKDGTFSKVRFVIQGPLYYAVVTKFKTEDNETKEFIESFSITPFKYPQSKEIKDTTLHFSVRMPSFKKEKEEEDESRQRMQEIMRQAYASDEEELYQSQEKTKMKIFGNDTIGEKVVVVYHPLSDYSFIKDTNSIWKEINIEEDFVDTSFIRRKRDFTLPNGYKCRETQITDTGSSKLLLSNAFYKNGKYFVIYTLTDTLSKRSTFIDEFIKSFQPDDSLKGKSWLTRKTEKFFNDFFSKDSSVARAARRALYAMEFDSLDVPYLMKAIDTLNWKARNYLEVKKYLISELGNIKHPGIAAYLKSLYLKVGDTSELQHGILDALLAQQTRESFVAFKDLMLQEPPIVDDDDDALSVSSRGRISSMPKLVFTEVEEDYHGKWSELYDTLSLTKAIFPDFLQLMTIDDYKEDVMDLLTTMVDSGYLKAADYENYFSKIYLDAKQMLKKQIAKEEKNKLERVSRDKSTVPYYPGWDEDEEYEVGNGALNQYSILLLPFWDKNPGVPTYFNQLMKTESRRILYETFILLLRNNKPVPDSLFQKFAALDEYRSELYADLKKMKKADKFPAAYKKQELMARSMLISSSDNYGKLDTLIYLDKLPTTYKNKKGYVYFFKYKRMKDDVSWQIASAGLQPENASEVEVDNEDFVEMDNRKIENDKPLHEQLEKTLKELLYSKHPSASSFYEGRSYNMYRNFLPDMVKSNRYRD